MLISIKQSDYTIHFLNIYIIILLQVPPIQGFDFWSKLKSFTELKMDHPKRTIKKTKIYDPSDYEVNSFKNQKAFKKIETQEVVEDEASEMMATKLRGREEDLKVTNRRIMKKAKITRMFINNLPLVLISQVFSFLALDGDALEADQTGIYLPKYDKVWKTLVLRAHKSVPESRFPLNAYKEIACKWKGYKL